MTEDETICFKLLDQYSKAHHACFLAEMFRSGADYTICFRPAGVQKESLNQYACKYLTLSLADVSSAARNGALPSTTPGMLDRELPTLPRA